MGLPWDGSLRAVAIYRSTSLISYLLSIPKLAGGLANYKSVLDIWDGALRIKYSFVISY